MGLFLLKNISRTNFSLILMLPLVPITCYFYGTFHKIRLKITLVCSLRLALVFYKMLCIFLKILIYEADMYRTQLQFATESQKANIVCQASLLKPKSLACKDEGKDNGHPSSTTEMHPS